MHKATHRRMPVMPAIGEAHVWRASLCEVDNDAVERMELPVAPAVRRSARPQDLRRGREGRWILRSILAAYLDCPPSQPLVVLRRDGKPELTYPWVQSGLKFNLSHSGDWLLLAVANGRDVGIDIERRKPLQDYEAVGRTCFAEEELQLLRGADRSRQCDLFYRLWTRKEAFGKATGAGLVAGDPAVTPLFPDGWSGAEINSLPGYAAAVVLEGDRHTIREFEFDSGRLPTAASEWRLRGLPGSSGRDGRDE